MPFRDDLPRSLDATIAVARSEVVEDAPPRFFDLPPRHAAYLVRVRMRAATASVCFVPPRVLFVVGFRAFVAPSSVVVTSIRLKAGERASAPFDLHRLAADAGHAAFKAGMISPLFGLEVRFQRIADGDPLFDLVVLGREWRER